MPASDPLLSLIASADPPLVRQGMELASALPDPAWFDRALERVTYRDTSRKDGINHSFKGSPLPGWALLELLLRAPAEAAEAARLRGEITSLCVHPRERGASDYRRIAALVNLQGLHLGNLEGIDLAALAAAPRLERLSLRACSVRNVDSACFPGLRSLSLRGLGLVSLAGLRAPALEELALEDPALEGLAGLDAPRLREVRLEQPHPEFSFAGHFPALEIIQESTAAFAPRDLAHLAGLRELSMRTDLPVPPLPSGLERLTIGSDARILRVAGLPNLRLLRLLPSPNLREVSLEALPRLEELTMHRAPVARGLEALPRLRSLEILYPDGRIWRWRGLEFPPADGPPAPLPPLPPSLRRLRLHARALPEGLPETLEELVLDLTRPSASLEPLRPLRGLRILSIQRAIEPRDLSVLADLPALEEIRMSPDPTLRLPPLPPRVRIVTE